MKSDFSVGSGSPGVGVAVGVGVTVLVPKARTFLGFSCAEASGTNAAEIRFHDGPNTSYPLLALATLQGNESSPVNFLPEGGEMLANGQISLEVVSGSVRGVLFWG
jgi:hypothetical protein